MYPFTILFWVSCLWSFLYMVKLMCEVTWNHTQAYSYIVCHYIKFSFVMLMVSFIIGEDLHLLCVWGYL